MQSSISYKYEKTSCTSKIILLGEKETMDKKHLPLPPVRIYAELQLPSSNQHQKATLDLTSCMLLTRTVIQGRK